MEESAELPDIRFFGMIVKGGTTATYAEEILVLRRQYGQSPAFRHIHLLAGTASKMNQD